MEKLGVVETKEMLKGLLALTALLATKLKDGVQVEDALAIYSKLQSDPEFSALLLAAYNGIEKVPSEVKDIDTGEAIELAITALMELPNILKAIKA
jgi:type II secretory pathway component PulF